RPRLDAYIRGIDYLGAKQENRNSDDNPGDKLLDYEGLVNFDSAFNIEELKSGYAAFREKVCVSKFPGRHSGPYWVAYSTLCVLERLSNKFDKNESQLKAIGREQFETWLALLKAKPSSGHVDLMSLVNTDRYKLYIQSCSPSELDKILASMKMKFSYDPSESDEESTYADFLHTAIVKFFNKFEKGQLDASRKSFLDLYMFYRSQLCTQSEMMQRYHGDTVRDMRNVFEDENPYKGLKDAQVLKQHLEQIKEEIRTTDSDLGTLQVQETLKCILCASSQDELTREIFSECTDIIVTLALRTTRPKNSDRIFLVFRMQLFRDYSKKHGKPDSSVFTAMANMCIKTSPVAHTLPEDGLRCISEAFEYCWEGYTNLSSEETTLTLKVWTLFLESGKEDLTNRIYDSLRDRERLAQIVWKEHMEEVKGLMEAVRKTPEEKIENFSHYQDVMKDIFALLKKSKLLNTIRKDITQFVFDCAVSQSFEKSRLGETASEFIDITKNDGDLIEFILDTCLSVLQRTELFQKFDGNSASAIQRLLTNCLEAYKGNPKLVTDVQHKKWLKLLAFLGEDMERLFPEEEPYTVYLILCGNTWAPYIALIGQTPRLNDCLVLFDHSLKIAKLVEENSNGSFSFISSISLAMLMLFAVNKPPGIGVYADSIMDLFLEVEECSNLSILVNNVYPLNPTAVHARIQACIDRIQTIKDSQVSAILSVLTVVATKHPEVFNANQTKYFIEMSTNAQSNLTSTYLAIAMVIARNNPAIVAPHYKMLMTDKRFKPDSLPVRIIMIVNIAAHNTAVLHDVMDFLVSIMNSNDPELVKIVIGQLSMLAKKDQDYMKKHKPTIEKLQNNTKSLEMKDSFQCLLDIIDGKGVEELIDGLQQQQQIVSTLEVKVGATMNTVISLGEQVIKQTEEISDIQQDLEKVEERVEVVETDIDQTKLKVEEIDNKTMTNAPKWSRDLSKLMNPEERNDWRLLASRLGYKNADIKAWAQQHDPCMALLSEWYATHKTSEANKGLFTALQEMNRVDGLIIVENAMKIADNVVEDDEFEYASPPPVFLSYQWGIQNEVKLLKQHLESAGYVCWMDIGQMGGGDNLFEKIDNGIRGAKVIVSCTTEKYAKSPNCNREVNLAVNLGKPIIPLLMEKMDWPPKGSMGPIFSEYLFVRFFQRSGEETADSRYWPVEKFQELLMQLNFYAVPDHSLLKSEYKDWWKPITEEIKIEKKKDVTSQQQNKQEVANRPSPQIFLSYQWGKQPQVKALYERLLSLGYTVWMDIFQMGGGDSLYDKIDKGVRGANVVVSCVTPKYALSANCRREISLADALKKPLVPLMLEQMKWPPDGPMSMVFTELLYINMCKDDDIQKTWSGPKFDELVTKLHEFIADNGQVVKAVASTVKAPVQEKANVDENTTPKRQINTKTDKASSNKSQITPQSPSMTAITLVRKTDQTPEVKAMHSVASSPITNDKPSVNSKSSSCVVI
ncbi:hypothetical protein DPMN_110644, partial [Dreissena polymorpha]